MSILDLTFVTWWIRSVQTALKGEERKKKLKEIDGEVDEMFSTLINIQSGENQPIF